MNLTLQRKLLGHKGSIYSLVYDVYNQHLYSGGGDGWLVRWGRHESDGKLIADIGDKVFSLQDIDEWRLAAGSMSGELYLIGKTPGVKPRKKIFHTKGVYDFETFEGYLISAGGDGKLGFWNLETTEIEESIALSHQRLRALALNHNQTILAIGSSSGEITLLSTQDWSVIASIPKAHTPSVFTLEWLESDLLVSGGRDAHLRVWDRMNLSKPIFDVPAHWFTVNHIQIHPHQPVLVTGSRDKTIRLWHAGRMEILQTLDKVKAGGHINSVNRLAWSSDGYQLFGASDDATISVWAPD